MAFPTIIRVTEAATQHPVLTVYLAGAAAMLAVLIAIAFSRPRAFGVAVEAAARLGHGRRAVLAMTVVMWSLAWPVTLLVVVVRLAWWR